jgi:hypothetical protein
MKAPLRLIVGVASLVLVTGCGEPPPEDPEAPLVPRLASAGGNEANRIATVRDLLNWGSDATPVAHINTATDRLPNQLAITMLPVFADWTRFERDNRNLRIRNVNVAGNPITGHNILATVDVPLDGLNAAEWCLSPPRTESNKDGFGGHGQIRFLFDPADRPLALDNDGTPLTGVEYMDDLMVSWEAWRPPRDRWSAKAGLDPDSYALTLRVYSGAKRFLDDSVRNNPWICYPLVLPGDRQGVEALFLSGIIMGDALARRTLREMVESGVIEVPDTLLDEYSEADLAQARQTFSESEMPEDPLTALMGKADLTYHLIQRSCVTLSLFTVQMGLDRIHKELELGPAPKLTIVPDELPPWTSEIAHADRGELLTLLPGVVLFVAENSYILPGNAHVTLEENNLVERNSEGNSVFYYYHRSAMTPWGPFRDNLM